MTKVKHYPQTKVQIPDPDIKMTFEQRAKLDQRIKGTRKVWQQIFEIRRRRGMN